MSGRREWLKAPDGRLADYPHRNVLVFDSWDISTGEPIAGQDLAEGSAR